MSVLANQAGRSPDRVSDGFAKIRPQVLRVVLLTFGRAVAATTGKVGANRVLEPRFTRQLYLDFQAARDATPGSPRYDISHQPEHVVPDALGRIGQLFRLDLRLVFARQLGRTGDYLCLECKYLDTDDRDTDREYVTEGVDRIVSGDYARRHFWAVMVGLERRGPLVKTTIHLDQRLRAKYGNGEGLKTPSDVRLAHVHQSEHVQAGGPHRVAILHALYLIA